MFSALSSPQESQFNLYQTLRQTHSKPAINSTATLIKQETLTSFCQGQRVQDKGKWEVEAVSKARQGEVPAVSGAGEEIEEVSEVASEEVIGEASEEEIEEASEEDVEETAEASVEAVEVTEVASEADVEETVEAVEEEEAGEESVVEWSRLLSLMTVSPESTS